MITVLGSVNIDFTTIAERLPNPGETVVGSGFSRAPGGKGANQALAAARAGANVRLVGRIGDDIYAQEAIQLLQGAGADLSCLAKTPIPTGSALITVSSDGENTIVVVPGANHLVDKSDVSAALADMASDDLLLLQMEIPAGTVEVALVEARARKILTMLNLAPIVPGAQRLGRLADILVTNETEFELFAASGPLSTVERENRMLELASHTGQTLVVTLGAEGVVAARDGAIIRAKSLEIMPVDTVGAGDTFCGYLAAGLNAGLAFQQALEQAAAAGSLACLGRGAQPSIPHLSEVARYL